MEVLQAGSGALVSLPSAAEGVLIGDHQLDRPVEAVTPQEEHHFLSRGGRGLLNHLQRLRLLAYILLTLPYWSTWTPLWHTLRHLAPGFLDGPALVITR